MPSAVKMNKIKDKDVATSLTHTRPEPETPQPTERERPGVPISAIFLSEESKRKIEMGLFSPEQEEARKAEKAGKLGIKFDEEKTRFDLLPWNEVKQVADVLTLGAKKYADDNWKYVPNGKKRYFAAAMRHLVAWKEGEKYDGETKFNHLAHALCCIFFLLFLDNNDEKNTK
jgi:hypothetical protein